MKWILDNWLKLLAVYFGYTLLWYFGWQLSVNFETITHITSWFLPAGIRVGSLLLFNKRYWVVIALAEFTGIYAVNSIEGPFASIVGEVIGTLPPILIYMFFIHQYLKSSKQTRFDSVQHVITLFAWVSLGTIITAVILVSSSAYQGHIPHDRLITTIVSFILGDFVGILFLVPIIFAIKELLIRQETFIELEWKDIIFILFSMIIALIFFQQHMIYYIKLFAFIPIILFAYRKGWIGASISIFIVNIVIVTASFFVADAGSMLEKQLYLIIISTTGLLLGAAMSEQQSLNYKLVRKNDELVTLIHKNQRLSKKVISVQEEERKIISRELHDELGQNITALKLNIKVIKQMLGSSMSKAQPILESMDSIANITYQSVYNLMHWLRPRVLDEMGLEKTLIGNKFEQLLDNASIQYTPMLEGELKLLNEDITIAIYRIVQESINNTIKYSKAKNYWLTLKVDHSNVEFVVKDDGIGFDVKSTSNLESSFGLQGIEDRVIALGGIYKLLSNSNGTTHTIIFKNYSMLS